MEYVLAVFGFGSLLLLVGLVGGDLSFNGATIPKVGTLPRFTTTLLGSAVLLLSLVLWVVVQSAAVQQAGGVGPGPDPTPPAPTDATPTARPVVTQDPTDGPPPPAPPPVPSRTPLPPRTPAAVDVQVVAALGEDMVAAQVLYSFDDAQEGGLELDPGRRSGQTSVRLVDGEHSYALLVQWIDVVGATFEASGAGSVAVAPGTTLEVRVDASGGAALVDQG